MSFKDGKPILEFKEMFCDECDQSLGFIEISWIDGYPDLLCSACFKKQNLTINNESPNQSTEQNH